MHKHLSPLEKDLTPYCAPHWSEEILRAQGTLQTSKYAIVCLTLEGIFGYIIVSSVIVELPSFCLDCNATEIPIFHLHVAPLYALLSLNTHPKRKNTQTCLHHSISQRKLSL